MTQYTRVSHIDCISNTIVLLVSKATKRNNIDSSRIYCSAKQEIKKGKTSMNKIRIKRQNKKDVKRDIKEIEKDITNCYFELKKIHNDTKQNLLNMKG